VKVVALSDTHEPFSDKYKIRAAIKLIKAEQPDVVVHLGDLYDFYMFSRFDKDLNIIHPKEELEYGHQKTTQMWKDIRAAAPNAKYKQLLGNHCCRVSKRIIQCLPALASEITSFHNKYFTYEGVTTTKSDREYILLDGVVYCHGWLNGCGAHKKFFEKCVVHGHSHHPDLVQDPLSKSNYVPFWELDTGCLADPSKAPFEYTSSVLTKWKPAVGIIDNAMPKLVML